MLGVNFKNVHFLQQLLAANRQCLQEASSRGTILASIRKSIITVRRDIFWLARLCGSAKTAGNGVELHHFVDVRLEQLYNS